MLHLGNSLNCPLYSVLCCEAYCTWMRALNSLFSALREPAVLGIAKYSTWTSTASLGKWKLWNTSCLKLNHLRSCLCREQNQAARSVYSFKTFFHFNETTKKLLLSTEGKEVWIQLWNRTKMAKSLMLVIHLTYFIRKKGASWLLRLHPLLGHWIQVVPPLTGHWQ